MIEMSRLSYSRLDLYNTCPRAFAMKYVHKAEPENDTADYFAEYGIIAHALYEEHANARGLIPKTVLTDMFHNGTETRDGMVKGFNDIKLPPYMANKYYQQGLDLIDRLLHTSVANVVGSEVKFSIYIEGIPVPIEGFIDKVERDERGYIITDFKSARPYTQEFCDESLQMSIYAMAALELYGELPYKQVYEFFRFNETVKTVRTMKQLEEAKQEIRRRWDCIQRKEFDPQYDQFFCNNFCQYAKSCSLKQQMDAEKAQRRIERAQRKQARDAKKAAKQQEGDV
ncbi:RecB family exonuclease [Alicyclobacillus acidoterrestris]|uniref:PD-(D/E)XK nuclease family protein n=1 Tax=Alicyclobacillus acidoterrestris (strain ATCC 49025 / DSM 3922 / CIP 106132 / NCIMB 13137 / GD3B) TaxID=1356854 RepID=T0DDN4_ALIAG|nr:PD-(D/E)XK nuclease family protein [Alicyclobacillus acidoterrestris]EPZ47766.1 hypothetical protein N007_05795 [Alicyclobacillus acidoterrestris ATCC 49025]UNO47931.1 PD-(D/E)XK nuclease family protein [Alicyclobacillus acidoterrestris]